MNYFLVYVIDCAQGDISRVMYPSRQVEEGGEVARSARAARGVMCVAVWVCCVLLLLWG